MFEWVLVLTKKFQVALLGACAITLLTGCQLKSEPIKSESTISSSASEDITPENVTPPQSPTPMPVAEREANVSGMQYCRKQLDAIKLISPGKYIALNKTFNKMMQRASQYSQIRKDVNGNTKETVDAFYTYRINLLCSDISQTLLVALSNEGNQP